MKAIGAVSAIDQAILLGKPLGSVSRRWATFSLASVCLAGGAWLAVEVNELLGEPATSEVVPVAKQAKQQPVLASVPGEHGEVRGESGTVQSAVAVPPVPVVTPAPSPEMPIRVEVAELTSPPIPKSQPISKPSVATVTASAKPVTTAATSPSQAYAQPTAPQLGPCATAIAGKTTISMEAIGVRSILPGALTYSAAGKQCVLTPGTKLGDEVVRIVDAELLKVHTSKRVIQLIDN